ncbi:hypothetical protein GGR54DRAFT_649356, partial [Hypoxylon sp. NC1633]
ERRLVRTVRFFVERTPWSIRGSACRLPGCDEKTHQGDYRIAVYPGIYSTADFYHVACFEKLVDFSRTDHLSHLHPLTRVTFGLRGLGVSSIPDYILDGGSERLILEWKDTMERLIARRDNIPLKTLDPAIDDLLHKSGSASYRSNKIPGVSDFELSVLSHYFAPIQSEGPEDEEEWNLFEEFMPIRPDDTDGLNRTDSLSHMLNLWHSAKSLANRDKNRLTDGDKRRRKDLGGEKAMAAIMRLSHIQMPDLESSFCR